MGEEGPARRGGNRPGPEQEKHPADGGQERPRECQGFERLGDGPKGRGTKLPGELGGLVENLGSPALVDFSVGETQNPGGVAHERYPPASGLDADATLAPVDEGNGEERKTGAGANVEEGKTRGLQKKRENGVGDLEGDAVAGSGAHEADRPIPAKELVGEPPEVVPGQVFA